MARRKKTNKKDDKKKVVIYCRASTGKQEISPEAQEQRLRQQAEFKGFEVIDVLVDKGISGGKGQDDRPGLKKALSMLEEDKANTLMVTKLDRLSRSVSDGSKMIERYFRGRYDLVVLEPEIDTTSDFGEFTANLMLNIGQLERRLISTRTAEALAYLSSKGVVLGGRMFGWKHTDKRDESKRRIRKEIPEEQEAIKTMIDMRAKGATFDKIAMRMNMEAIPTVMSGKWYQSDVRNIIEKKLETNKAIDEIISAKVSKDIEQSDKEANNYKPSKNVCQDIAETLNNLGLQKPNGGKWYRGTVQKIIKRVTDAYRESKSHDRPKSLGQSDQDEDGRGDSPRENENAGEPDTPIKQG